MQNTQLSFQLHDDGIGMSQIIENLLEQDIQMYVPISLNVNWNNQLNWVWPKRIFMKLSPHIHLSEFSNIIGLDPEYFNRSQVGGAAIIASGLKFPRYYTMIVGWEPLPSLPFKGPTTKRYPLLQCIYQWKRGFPSQIILLSPVWCYQMSWWHYSISPTKTTCHNFDAGCKPGAFWMLQQIECQTLYNKMASPTAWAGWSFSSPNGPEAKFYPQNSQPWDWLRPHLWHWCHQHIYYGPKFSCSLRPSRNHIWPQSSISLFIFIFRCQRNSRSPPHLWEQTLGRFLPRICP